MSLIGTPIPPAFPLVGLAVASTYALSAWQFIRVGGARKAAKVDYPNLYASDAEAKADPKKMVFNCHQRAHANTLESIPYILAMLLFLGFYHPKFASGSTALWVIGKIGYTIGYATGNPKKRTNPVSAISYFGLLGLFFGSIYVAGTKTYELYF
ncbi:hypothetical protein P7C73_g4857, partial [Tremellales sp. Uapishka_1]